MSLIKPREIVWSDLHSITSILLLHMAIPRPSMYGEYYVYPVSGCGISMQLIPHLVGQVLLLLCKSGGPGDIVCEQLYTSESRHS